MICVLVEEIVGGRHEDGLEGLCRAAADRQRCQHCVLGVCVSERVCVVCVLKGGGGEGWWCWWVLGEKRKFFFIYSVCVNEVGIVGGLWVG